MRSHGQVQLLDQLSTHQVVGASPVNDHLCSAVFNDDENLKQIMALQLFWLSNLCVEDSLNYDAPVGGRVIAAKVVAIIISLVIF
jgi:hypothetical protein